MRKKTLRRPAPKGVRERWEYDVKEFFGPWTSEAIEVGEALQATKDFLNKRGRDGWEITAVLRNAGTIPDTYVIFKRRS